MADATFDYAGLNHLGWLRRVLVDGDDRLPSLLADAELLGRIEEGRLFGAEWLQTLGSIPNEYLWYWYFRSDALAAELAGGRDTRRADPAPAGSEFYARDGPGTAGCHVVRRLGADPAGPRVVVHGRQPPESRMPATATPTTSTAAATTGSRSA